MNSTAVLDRPTYKVSSPELNNVSGKTEYAQILKGALEIYWNSTVVTSVESISTQNKLEIQRIKELAKLDANWDGDNASKISDISIANAISLIEDINFHNVGVYFTAPGPNSDIMVQLKNGSSEIEFIVYPTKTKYVRYSKNKLVDQGNYENKILPSLIEWLYSE